MNDLVQLIVQHSKQGKIDKQEAAELLKVILKDEGTDGRVARHEDMAIVGIAVKFPQANNMDEFWGNIRGGLDCISDYPAARQIDSAPFIQSFWNSDQHEFKFNSGGYLQTIAEFDAKFFQISPKEASLMDPHQRLFLETAWEALEDAGYGGKKLSGSQTGIYLGYNSERNYGQFIAKHEPLAAAISVTGNLPPVTVGRIAYLLNFKGPCVLIDTACSSSLVAVHFACKGIMNGDCDQAIAGGVRITLTPAVGVNDSELGLVSKSNKTKAFDEHSDGTIWGEGVAALLIKPYQKALRDHDHIHAIIKGSAVNHDGRSAGLTAPNSIAQAEVIMKAWREADIDPETITYIEAHGTGTKLGDPIEIDGIQKAFRKFTPKKQFCAIGSVKSNIGHLDSMAGMAGLVKAVLALKHRELPPTLYFDTPNRKINFMDSPVFVSDRVIPWQTDGYPRRCGVSSFGFSGTNCHIVLEEALENNEQEHPDVTDTKGFLAMSAKNEKILVKFVVKQLEFLKNHPGINLKDYCYTLNTGRGHYYCRLLVVFDNYHDLVAKLTGFYPAETAPGAAINGIFYGVHKPVSADKDIHDKSERTESQVKELTKLAGEKLNEWAASNTKKHEIPVQLWELYIQGAELDWEKLYQGEERQKIHAPVYPFERTRCWLLPVQAKSQFASWAGPDIYYAMAWQPADLAESNQASFSPRQIIILKNSAATSGNRLDGLEKALCEAGCDVAEITTGAEFQQAGNCYQIPNSEAGYQKLMETLPVQNEVTIIHMLTVSGAAAAQNPDELAAQQEMGVFSLLYLAKSLSGRKLKVNLWLISAGVHEVTGNEPWLNPGNATLFGLGKTLGIENPDLKCRCIDIDDQTGVNQIIAELKFNDTHYQAAYRAGKRYVEELTGALPDPTAQAPGIRRDGVYLITGGAGGIGLAIGKYLASQNTVNLVLINRTPLPDRHEWDAILQREPGSAIADRIAAIREIEASGSEVVCYSADIAREQELRTVLQAVRAKWGPVHGIVHCAGVVGGGLMRDMDAAHLRKTLAPKVQGTWLLDHLTTTDPLDFFILFSSAATVTGGSGNGDYVAANAYQDAFSFYRNQQGRKTLAINWPIWGDTGMAKGMAIEEKRQVFAPLTAGDAIPMFAALFQSSAKRLIAGRLNLASPVLELAGLLPFTLSEKLAAQARQAKQTQFISSTQLSQSHPVKITGTSRGNYRETEQKLAQIWSQVLGFEELNIHDNFFEIGGDSILLLSLQSLIDKQFPGKVTVADLFAYPSIARLAEFLEQKGQSGRKTAPAQNLPETVDPEIAIIGMAAKFPGAGDYREFWANLKQGVDSVGEFPGLRQRDANVFWQTIHIGEEIQSYNPGGYLAEIDKFDYQFFRLSPKEASVMDPNQRLFLENVWEAIEDAGYGSDQLAGSKTGIYVGYNNWPLYGQLANRIEPFSAMATPGNIASIIPSRISYILNLKGPALLVDTACSSSLVAVHLACQGIRNRDCTMAVAGGIRINILPVKDNSDFGIQSAGFRTRAFDENADGVVWGEGVASVLLKPLSQALVDGDHIYAVIKGSATNQDGSSIGITAPNVIAQEEVIIEAWQKAGIDPETITYIEAHGTGTKLGDPIEIDGLKRSFGRYTDKKQFCAIGSIKPNIGHSDCVAGMAGLIKAVLALQHQEIPPSIHFQVPNRKIDFEESPLYVNHTLRRWETDGGPKRCGVSSFGISGTNCHIVLEEAPPSTVATPVSNDGWHVLTLSAKSEKALQDLIIRYRKFIGETPGLGVAQLCYTANTGRGHYKYRLAIITSGETDLKTKLARFNPGNVTANTGDGVFYNYHSIVPGNRRTEDPHELSESQRQELTHQAVQKLTEILAAPAQAYGQLAEICGLYVKGAGIPWDMLYHDGSYQRVSLPVYPFERNRCWLDLPETGEIEIREPDPYFTIAWRPEAVPAGAPQPFSAKTLVVYEQPKDPVGGRELELIAGLRSAGTELLELQISEESETGKRKANGALNLRITGSYQDYQRTFQEHSLRDVARIIFVTNISNHREIDSLHELEQTQVKGVNQLVHLVKALVDSDLKHEVEIILVAGNVHRVTGTEPWLNPEAATLIGLGKTVGMENIHLICRAIDLDEATGIPAIIAEISTPHRHYLVAYRAGQRYLPEIQTANLAGVGNTDLEIKDGNVYLITGGTGGIGLEVARFLAGEAKVKLCLINRSPMPKRLEWEQILAEGKDRKLCKKIEAIQSIERSGSEVYCYSADVADHHQMEAAISEIRAKYGRIHGIFHGAGVAGDGFLIRKTDQAFQEVIRPKVHGTWVLDRLTQKDNPDFMVLFSSITALLGGPGQGDYTAANSYLDSYAAYRRQQGRRTLAINWPAWLEIGMAVDFGANVNGVFKTIATASAIQALKTVLSKEFCQVVIGELNLGVIRPELFDTLPFMISPELRAAIVNQPANETGALRKSGSTIEKPQVLKSVVLQGGSCAPAHIQGFSSVQKSAAQIWGNIFGVAALNLHDDFFELGGDSISAMQIVNLVNQTLDVRLEVVDLLRNPIFEDFSRYLEQQCAGSNRFSAIRPVAEQACYPVSSAQKRLFILNQMERNQIHYNIPGATIIEGKLDRKRLEEVFDTIIRRHESLRTRFAIVDGRPVQYIEPTLKLRIDYRQAAETEIGAILKDFIRPFDLSRAPLLRAGLVELSPLKHLLIYDMHHIISDGTSLRLLIQEFIDLYHGQEPPPLRIQYKDYAAWQNELVQSGAILKQEEYWLARFAGEIPVLNLPSDYPRPAAQSFEGGEVWFEIPPELSEGINRVAAAQGATFYMVLLAAYYILLFKYSGQEDIVIGSPIAGRSHADLEKIIGMLVNTLALRNFPAGTKTFLEFLAEVRENSLKAYENQDYQFEELVEKLELHRDLSRNPLFDVMFILQKMEVDSPPSRDVRFRNYPIPNESAKFDLTLQILENDAGLDCRFEYCAKLYTPETLQRMAGHLQTILGAIVVHPELKLAELEILTPAEKQQVLYGFNNTTVEYSREKTVHQLFKEQVERTPDQIALAMGDRQLTYRELDEVSGQLAYKLREMGVGANHLVGIMCRRSPELILGILGTLKSGGAYLPIDPDYPGHRIQYILEDGKAQILLTNGGLTPPSGFNGATLQLDEGLVNQSGKTYHANQSSSRDLAYVIHTSGSTGTPKGVMIEHRGVHNFIRGVMGRIDFSVAQTILALTTVSFDIFGLETLLPLTLGLKVVIAAESEQRDSQLLSSLIIDQRVDLLQITPSRLRLLLLDPGSFACFERLSAIMIGGEALPEDLFRQVRRLTPARIYNMYGPTETTIWSTIKDLTAGGGLNIGTPIANTRIYIVNSGLHPQPVGIPGEICIAGDGLARGYWGKPDLTSEKFIPVPDSLFQNTGAHFTDTGDGWAIDNFAQSAAALEQLNQHNAQPMMYKTGDLGRWRADGNIEFLGRIDHQVKVRGYRIELGEIEGWLAQHEAVKEAVVIVRDDAHGEKYLCAYLTGRKELTVQELRQHLEENLPEYMIPAFFVQLEDLPLTPNGKLDRKAIAAKDPEPGTGIATGVEYEAPRNEVEQKLAAIWEEVLGISSVGINDNFFSQGGNSMKAVTLMLRVNQELNTQLPLQKVFEIPTIKALAKFITTMTPDNHTAIQPVPRQDYYPVSSAQKRTYLLSQHADAGTSFNLFNAVIIEGGLEIPRLENAFRLLIDRHESLRTSFKLMSGEIVQQIEDAVDFKLGYQEWEPADKTPEPERIENELRRLVQPFDLSRAPLFRANLVKIREGRYLLVYDMHHIISDGTSMAIIMKELVMLYYDRELPVLRIQYKDFAAWQNQLLNSEAVKQQEAYWLKKFAGGIPVLNLRLDYPRPDVKGFEGDDLRFTISLELTAGLNRLALQTEATLFMVLFAAYNILLHKYTGQEDIIIGSNVAGRSHPDLENIIGMYLNILPLRNYPKADRTFREFLAEVKTNTLEAFANQDCQFEIFLAKLNLQRDLSRNPLFDTVFTMQDFRNAAIQIDEVRFTQVKFSPKVSRMDLMFMLSETDTGIEVIVEYSTQLFKRSRIESISKHYQEILSQIVTNPDIRIRDLVIANQLLTAATMISDTDSADFQF